MSRPRVLKANTLVGTTGDKHSFNAFNTKFDQQLRTFVIDTGSSDHLCIDKSLYIEEIIPLTHVKLQGVDGMTKAKGYGYGTITFSLFDDDGVKPTFVIHNVVYVPDTL